jgi:hypothetical protein
LLLPAIIEFGFLLEVFPGTHAYTP